MDQDKYLVRLRDAETIRDRLVKDLVCFFYLYKMIATPETTELWRTTGFGIVRNFGGISRL